MSLDRGMDIHTYTHKHACVHTMEYYSAIKTSEIVSFAETWVDLEAAIQSEVSQSEKHKYHVLTHICADFKKWYR